MKPYIDYLESIPADKWNDNQYFTNGNKRCVIALLTAKFQFKDVMYFINTFHNYFGVMPSFINDKKHQDYQQDTAKERILTACNIIYNKENDNGQKNWQA